MVDSIFVLFVQDPNVKQDVVKCPIEPCMSVGRSIHCPSNYPVIKDTVGFEVSQFEIDIENFLAIFGALIARHLSTLISG